jgi:outer membrane autotransporter protein
MFARTEFPAPSAAPVARVYEARIRRPAVAALLGAVLALAGVAEPAAQTDDVLAPVVTSPDFAAGQASVPFSYQITADNNPTSFGATGLPPGLEVNAATGRISGTPAASDALNVTVSATNAAGTGTLDVFVVIAPAPPVAGPATLTVPLDTPTTIDLATYISGTGITGVAISSEASHGTTEVRGTKVTYFPKPGYFGPDAFGYYAFGEGGTSSPATVAVTVTGRPDPAQDPNVVALVGAQEQVARRFARAQVGNVQRRMETRHVDPGSSEAASAKGARAGPAGPASGTGLWIGGDASFGSRNGRDDSAGSRFSTDGITVGADLRLDERLVLGFGVGYARDKSRFGSDGTQMTSDGYSVAAYASYQPTRSTFVDALLGYGTLNFDTRRYVVPAGEFAVADRNGRQIFGSVAGGLEWRNDSVLVSPYARLDFAAARFDQATESGAGSHALTYRDQTQNTVQGTLGLRAETQHATDFGLMRPRARFEYRYDFEGSSSASVNYADQRAGPTYSVSPPATQRNVFVAGVGADFLFRGGLRLGIDYQLYSSGGSNSDQTLRLLLAQDFDGKGSPTAAWLSRPLADAVQVEGGFTFDDNVSRGRDADEILSDKIYSLTARTSRTIPIGDNAQAVMTGLLNGEAFHTYTGLAHVSGGAQAELQYRGSAAFDAVTFAAFARGWLDGYESSLRTGGRYTFGVSARRSLTDRIDVHGEVTYNQRRAQSAVWDLNDWSARLSLDWSLGRRGTLYLIGDYRRGDTVADGVASLLNASLAEVFVLDDAFPGDRLFAYRFDGTTWIGTLGYSLPLGPRDAIDVSWRHAQTTPDSRPGFDVPGSLRYVDNQYSIVYVLRF